MSAGKSLRLFLADGTPGGLTTAEIMNWTGHVVAAPRSEVAALLQRDEVSRTGIYILLGEALDEPGTPMAYIGEGDDVEQRLRAHARESHQGGKDFWTRAVVLTSKDANLTKAHARYLESRLIRLAASAGRARLDNSTSPPTIALPEADRSDMEYFIEQAKIVLPVLGVNILRSAEIAELTSSEATAAEREDVPFPAFTLTSKKHGISAAAQEIDGEFTVLKGSTAREGWTQDSSISYSGLRGALERDGVLAPTSDGRMTFTRSHVFASPSAAAAVVMGRSANGRKEWVHDESGLSYGQWQQQGV